MHITGLLRRHWSFCYAGRSYTNDKCVFELFYSNNVSYTLDHSFLGRYTLRGLCLFVMSLITLTQISANWSTVARSPYHDLCHDFEMGRRLYGQRWHLFCLDSDEAISMASSCRLS